jgi:hypothetical protein
VPVIELSKPVAVGRDSGTTSGGAATEVPMLDQPPSTGVTATGAERDAGAGPAPAGGAGHAGAEVVPLVGVLVHGDETPLLVGLLAALGFADVVIGLADGEAVMFLKPCSAALTPALNPSRTAVPVSLIAFCVRCVIEGALGAGGWL